MVLYFVNGSKQRKEVVESDYAEDMIDVIIDFFESHHKFPHVMKTVRIDQNLMITMENTAEHFLITDVNADDETEITKWSNDFA